MTKKEKEIRKRLKNDFPHYADRCLKIRTKSGSVERFNLNRAQKYIHDILTAQTKETGRVRAIVLKGRQQGCSTYVEARLYHLTTHRKGVRAFILTHQQDATNNLFEMAQRFHEYCPAVVRPKAAVANAKELRFDLLDSGYKIGTAGTKEVGRSQTIQYFHGSEVAFWPNADSLVKGVMQAVPDQPGTEIILESTANGEGNYFHQMWCKAEAKETDFVPIFIPWFWQDEYRKEVKVKLELSEKELELVEMYGLDQEQIAWRRNKIAELTVTGIDGEKGFKQEYPCNPIEAFQTTAEDVFIHSDVVMRARKVDMQDSYGALVIGVDPARYGDDRTSIIRRIGRRAFGVESYRKKSTMEVAGIVVNIIRLEKPQKVFVDVCGLGAGVVDRLLEMGFGGIVIPVNAGEKALNPNRYSNRRAELWGEMKVWLNEHPCKLPNSATLQSDLCAIKYTYNSSGLLVMEKKEDMKKRGIRSPDEGDALALTFAHPVPCSDDEASERYKATRHRRRGSAWAA